MIGEERLTRLLSWYGAWKRCDANFLVKIGSVLGQSEIWISSLVFLLLAEPAGKARQRSSIARQIW